MKWFLYLVVGTVMTSFSASAAIFSYITQSSGTPADAVYWYTIERWDEYIDDRPNSCSYNPCYVMINHKHTSTGAPGSPVPNTATNITGLKTMREVRAAVLRKTPLPYSGIGYHIGEPLNNNQECVGLFFQPSDSEDPNTGGRMIDGSLCGIAPPPVGACKIENSSLLLDFKDVDEASLQGQTRDVAISVTCNLAMDVLVIASGMNNGRVKLRDDNSLNAKLYLGNNDTPGESGYKLFVAAGGTSIVKLKAVLDVNGRVSAGPFSGSASIILTVP